MGLQGILSTLLYGQNAIRYHLVPVLFLLGFTASVHVLMVWVHGHAFSLDLLLENQRSDAVSWAITLGFFVWAWASIRISNKIHLGPETSFGLKPKYADNGFSYFTVTMITYLMLQAVFPGTSRLIFDKFPKIIAACSHFALLFCLWLHIKGKYFRDHKGDVAEKAPIPYEYYRGMELHPRFFGVDVKQWTNCRVGMMAWPLLLTAFFIVSIQTYGYNASCAMHFLIQLIYIAKFYWWETGYFHTIDMMVDRAGYYLAWGCLVFIAACFCFPAAYVINEAPVQSDCAAYLIGGIGIALTLLEYWVDEQKHGFRSAYPKEYVIWGKPATFILAEYTDNKGNRKTSPLLTSGFWGIARHCNYTCELCICFTISATLGFNHGLYTFLYFLFIAPLIFHRIIRDDAKCSEKYKKDWLRYKNEVRYVLIPGIY